MVGTSLTHEQDAPRGASHGRSTPSTWWLSLLLSLFGTSQKRQAERQAVQSRPRAWNETQFPVPSYALATSRHKSSLGKQSIRAPSRRTHPAPLPLIAERPKELTHGLPNLFFIEPFPKMLVRCFQRPNRSFICFCFVRFHFFFVRAQFTVRDFSANLPTPLLQVFLQPPASPKLPVKVHVLCTASMETTNEFTRFSVQSVRRLQPH